MRALPLGAMRERSRLLRREGACKKCDFCAHNLIIERVHEKSFERDKTFFRDLRDNRMFAAILRGSAFVFLSAPRALKALDYKSAAHSLFPN